MILNLVDTHFLKDLLLQKIYVKDLKYTKFDALFPFIYVILNGLSKSKDYNKIDLMKKHLLDSYELFTPEEKEIQATLTLMKLKPNVDWRLKWILPLKNNYKDLKIFTTDKSSYNLYRNENIEVEPFFT